MDGRIVVDFDMGGESMTLKSSGKSYHDGNYHWISFERVNNHGTMTVDSSAVFKSVENDNRGKEIDVEGKG